MGHFKSVAMFWRSVVLYFFYICIRVGTIEAHLKNNFTFVIKPAKSLQDFFEEKTRTLVFSTERSGDDLVCLMKKVQSF